MKKPRYRNYIFLKYYNYLYFNQINNPAQVFSIAKNNLKQRYRKNFLQSNGKTKEALAREYEKTLNYFYKPEQSGDLFNKDIVNQIDKAIGAYLERTKGARVAITRGGKAGIATEKNKVYTDLVFTAKKITAYNDTIASIEANLRRFEETLKALPKHTANSRYFANQLKKLQTQWKNVQKCFTSDNVDERGRADLTSSKSSELVSFIRDYNKMLAEFFTQSKGLTGDIGELRSLLISYLAYTGEEAVHDFMNLKTATQQAKFIHEIALGQKHKGFSRPAQDTSKKGFSETLFSSQVADVLDDIFEGTSLIADELNQSDGAIQMFFTKPTQNKVDVKIAINGEPLNLTVKNYDLSSDKTEVHMVSDTNPYVLIEKDAEFLSHYLNITSEHGYYTGTEEERESRYEIAMQHKYPGINVNKKEPLMADLNEAHETIKLLMFSSALAGGQRTGRDSFNDQADMLVINDNVKGKWRVYWVEDIINKAINNTMLISIAEGQITKKNTDGIKTTMDGFHKKGTLYSIAGWQAYDTGGVARMTNIYKELAKQHIYISLKIKALNATSLDSLNTDI